MVQSWGNWVAQSVEHLTLAQFMISWSMSLSPMSGSMLTVQSLEPALSSVSSSLSASALLVLCLSVSVSLSLKEKQVNIFFLILIVQSHWKTIL